MYQLRASHLAMPSSIFVSKVPLEDPYATPNGEALSWEEARPCTADMTLFKVTLSVVIAPAASMVQSISGR